LGFLGLAIDPALNASVETDSDISAASARVPTLVVKAREDVEVAREVRRVLAEPSQL
jgi:acetate kinase